MASSSFFNALSSQGKGFASTARSSLPREGKSSPPWLPSGAPEHTARHDAERAIEDRTEPSGPRDRLFDSATLIGIAGAFALIAAAMWWNGMLSSFLNPASLFIVLGGTFFTTVASFTWNDMRECASDLASVLFHRRIGPRTAALDILRIAYLARRHGVLSLQGSTLLVLKAEPLLHKGLQLVIDGTPEQEVESILTQQAAATRARRLKTVTVLRRAADISPAMGLIGTLIGLVQMMERLDDPSTLGPGMAVALLTTFYGAIISHMALMPLASKLERNAREECLVHQVYMLGILSIGRRDNPRRLKMQLDSALPTDMRVGS